ncbi:MAG: methyltransferase domain-containing protein, partial [Pseudomonadota bacterium]
MTGDATIFDRELLTTRRQRAAVGAAAHDFLLQRVADDLAERLSIVNRRFDVAVDLGAHHGVLARRVSALPSVGRVIAAERAPGLLGQCPGERVLADEEWLPFGAESVDLVVSALALQYVNDLPGTLAQIRRILRPDGLLLASLLGGETLKELRAAWLEAEAEVEGGASPRVAPFVDVRTLGALLQRAGFALPVTDADPVTVRYPSALALMRDLKAMGASNALRSRSRKPTRRETLARACGIYERRFSDADGRVVATFEILTATAWAPHESQPKPLAPGSAATRLADALGSRERSAG